MGIIEAEIMTFAGSVEYNHSAALSGITVDGTAVGDFDRDILAYTASGQTVEAETDVKYQGYIQKEKEQIEQFNKMEHRRLPDDIDYDRIGGLRIEARQKLDKIRPKNLGQASRISGVSPADITVLMVFLKK